MGDTKFTLIELHLDGDTQFGPGSIGSALPFGSSSESEETPEYEAETELDADADESADDSSGKAVGTVVALVALVAIAVAARKFRGGDDEEDLETEAEPDVVVN